MKKATSILLYLAFLLCLSACGGDGTNPSEPETDSTKATVFNAPNLSEYENEFYGIHNAGQKQTLTVLSDTYEISVNEDGNYCTIVYAVNDDGCGVNGETFTATYNYYYKGTYSIADDGVTFSCRFDERYLAMDFSEGFTDSVRDAILRSMEPYIGGHLSQEQYDSYYALFHGETVKDAYDVFYAFYSTVFYGEKSGSSLTVTKIEEYNGDALRSRLEIGADEIRNYFCTDDFYSTTVYSLDGTPLQGEYHYSDGSYGYMEYYATGTQKTDTTYDSQGNMLDQLCYNENGDLVSIRYSNGEYSAYEYDADGNCIKEIYGDTDGVSQTWEYKYDNGVQVSLHVTYSDGSSYTDTYIDGVDRTHCAYDADGTLLVYIEYDENGNIVKEIYY